MARADSLDHAAAPVGRRRPVLALVGFLVAVGVAGAIGAAVTAPAVDGWYRGLAKPAFTPPDAVFGPVWTVLYLLMALAAWLVWRRGGAAGARRALALFALQLALNPLWSVLFFGLRRPDLALVEIVVLLAAEVLAVVAFARVRPLAAWLLAPLLAWTAFAAVLNGWIALDN